MTEAWYEITYYADTDGEAGDVVDRDGGFSRLRDAISVAKKDEPTRHAWIAWHKPNADDSGVGVWSREPLVPKDERTAIRWLLDAIKSGDRKRMNQVARVVGKLAPQEVAS